ncbi:MAG: type II secretion system protein [Candidatus Berkelbacteria bacterium]|nr:type II secretion system protein [Candidatus Berkelbacteria bacterium]
MIIKSNFQFSIFNFQFRKGQLLVEVLIGIGLMAILVSAVVPLMIASTTSFTKEQKNQTAILLAKEQIEGMKALKEQDWNNIYFPLDTPDKGISNPYHLVLSGSSWQLAPGSENISQNGGTFQRSIIIDNVSRTGSNGAGEINAVYNSAYDDPSTQKIRSIITGTGGAPYAITEYLTRWSNQLWSQTDWSGGQFTTQTNIDTTTIPGALLLAKTGVGGTGTYGNRSLLSSTTTIGRLNNTARRASMRFTAQKTADVNQVRVYLNNANNSGATFYRYGIQADNSGLASGVYLASGIATFSTTGWKNINLSSNANLTFGTVYHLVVQYDSGITPNNNRYIDIRNSDPQNNLVPLNQAADNNQNTLFFSGGLWTVQNRQPIYVLRFIDNTFEGNPYDSSQARQIYENNFEGELFTVSAEANFNALNLYIAKNVNQNPSAPLRIVLRDITAAADIIDDSTITGAALTTAYQWKTFNFAPDKTLTAGHQYRLYLSSQGSATNRHYLIYAESNPNTADFNSINWDGTNSVASRSVDGGGAWTESNFIDMTGYYFTTVLPQSYANSGELISTTFDGTKRVGFNRISYSAPALPLGTSIKFQIAVKENADGPWDNNNDFKGPQGSTADFYTISAGENTFYNASNNQYLRHKVILETTNPDVTPTLNDITINFSP